MLHSRAFALTMSGLGLVGLAWTMGVRVSWDSGIDGAESGPPVTMSVRGGVNQSAQVGRELPEPIVVRVSDEDGNPVPGVPVTFIVTSGGGSLFFPTTTTGSGGEAVNRWTLGRSASERQAVEARVLLPETGVGLSVEFTARALAGPPRDLTVIGGDGRVVSPGGVVFTEDFEDGLARWVGRGTGGAGHHAEVVTDPLDPENRAVRFTKPVAAGDLFSLEVPVDPSGTYVLTFQYLGLAVAGSTPGNHGGFIGLAGGIPGTHTWLAGTEPWHSASQIVDDGSWHRYTIRFVPSEVLPGFDRIRVMLEDAEVANGVPRDSYFDDIVLTRVGPGS